MIKEAYCSKEVSKLLKEKGFPQDPNICNTAYTTKGKFSNNAKSFAFFNKLIKPRRYTIAPTYQMAMKWLREEKRISIIIEFDLTKRGYCPYVHQLDYDMDWVVKYRVNTPMKYEEAVEAALKYTLENLI